jgi:hypothetical protein
MINIINLRSGLKKIYNDQYVIFEKLIEEKYKNKFVKLRRELEQCQINGKIFQGMISSSHFAFCFLP